MFVLAVGLYRSVRCVCKSVNSVCKTVRNIGGMVKITNYLYHSTLNVAKMLDTMGEGTLMGLNTFLGRNWFFFGGGKRPQNGSKVAILYRF